MGSVAIYSDILFKNGFICSGASHEDGIVGGLASPAAKREPEWKLCQWACNSDICKGRYACADAGFSYETDSQLVAVSWEAGKPLLTLGLYASREYDAPRVFGQAWPHLLIEQTDLAKRCPPLGQLASLELDFAFRVPWFRCMMPNPKDSLHAAQINLFFTVSSVKTGDMFWFGVPVFDSRCRSLELFQAEDAGKDDASHKYIYTAAQRDFTQLSAHDGGIIDYRKDLLPLIGQGLLASVKAGYLASGDLGEYILTTSNLGFEMPGTFDASFEVYRLGLEAGV